MVFFRQDSFQRQIDELKKDIVALKKEVAELKKQDSKPILRQVPLSASDRSDHPTTSSGKSLPIEPTSNENVVSLHLITPKEILNSTTEQMTTIQREEMHRLYQGKRISVSGKVVDVQLTRISDSFEVEMTDVDDVCVILHFDKHDESASHLKRLRKGDTIKARGTFIRAGKYHVSLENCVLDKLPKRPPAPHKST